MSSLVFSLLDSHVEECSEAKTTVFRFQNIQEIIKAAEKCTPI